MAKTKQTMSGNNKTYTECDQETGYFCAVRGDVDIFTPEACNNFPGITATHDEKTMDVKIELTFTNSNAADLLKDFKNMMRALNEKNYLNTFHLDVRVFFNGACEKFAKGFLPKEEQTAKRNQVHYSESQGNNYAF